MNNIPHIVDTGASVMNEPVAWMMVNRENTSAYLTFEKPTRDMKISHQPTALYTHPVDAVNISKEYVDKTQNNRHEPVAWRTLCLSNIGEDSEWVYNEIGQGEPLYTHPVKELTDEEIEEVLTKIAMNNENVYSFDSYDVFESMEFSRVGIFAFARAILRKAQEK